MLKLPKGLKKKKKGKKSKKDQELFTEEELQQYKREHQVHSEHQTDEQQHPEKSENDDEWSKFAALTTGVDSILKKTQGDLDRIKSTSFFKRVPPPSEKVEEKTEEATAKEPLKEPEERDEAKELLNAVVELSESEEESEYDDSAFDTTFTDKVEAGELPLAYVPESPEEETDLGPDPFDTGYAEKVIKGPEVSSRGKRLVNIGAAVEVLTGKVETAAASAKTRRQRRGIQNLLLESFEANLDEGEVSAGSGPIVATTLLDEPTELEGDVPIDLSVSLHLNLLQQQQKNKQENVENQEDNNVLEEFDVLKKDDAIDGNAQLASQLSYTDKAKRPPPPSRPPQPTNLQILLGEEESEEEEGIDPFDTAYVERIVPKSIDYDDDFDPRAGAGEDDGKGFNPRAEDENNCITPKGELKVAKKDLLSTSHSDLADIAPTLAPKADVDSESEIDPFDTSAVNALVAPGKTELKYLEQELLESKKQDSLSDDDFDPRACEEVKPDTDLLRQRKSSLSLPITVASPKLVSFSVATPDLLKVDTEGGKIPKPLTPYYNRESSLTLDEEAVEDPFDTSFVPSIAPSSTELDLIEKEILKKPTLTHSLSDPDFDPRAVTPQPQGDLFLAPEHHDIKVLTPAKGNSSPDLEEIDPFDTSIAVNILPGSAELKLLEDELIEKKPEAPISSDILSDTQDNSIYVKILTPQATGSIDLEAQDDFDPFDTSFASNLAPGEIEIKLIENEFID